jgi:hypothetical protein
VKKSIGLRPKDQTILPVDVHLSGVKVQGDLDLAGILGFSHTIYIYEFTLIFCIKSMYPRKWICTLRRSLLASKIES